jgi:hypothetical protein
MGITWLIPPFTGGFFMAGSTTIQHSVEISREQNACPCSRARLWGDYAVRGSELDDLATASALKSQIHPETTASDKSQIRKATSHRL